MKLADYSDRVTADQLDTALRLGGFEGVFHYLSGNNALRIETPDVVAAVRQRGWPQLGIDVPTLTAVDGQAASRAAVAYGFGPGFRLYLDIEPGEFAANPTAWAQAANAWCNDVHAARFSPGIYGTDATVAACSNNADTIWRAKPGMCDPAGPGLASDFFAGRRAVQCAQENHNGISFDVSYSQFTVAGPAQRPAAGESSMVIIPAPQSVSPGRLDAFALDAKRNVVSAFSDGGAGGLDSLPSTAWIVVGTAPAGGFRNGSLSACWDSLQRRVLAAEDHGGNAYMAVVNLDGSLAQDWAKLSVSVALPEIGSAVAPHTHPVTVVGTSGQPS